MYKKHPNDDDIETYMDINSDGEEAEFCQVDVDGKGVRMVEYADEDFGDTTETVDDGEANIRAGQMEKKAGGLRATIFKDSKLKAKSLAELDKAAVSKGGSRSRGGDRGRAEFRCGRGEGRDRQRLR